MDRMVNRRNVLASGAAMVTGLAALGGAAEPRTREGHIKQSVAYWCFNSAGDKWELDKLCGITKQLGGKSVELIGPEGWATLKKHGLQCALAPNGLSGAPFMRGVNNPRYHEEVIAKTKAAIEACAEAHFPSVIAFTGYKWDKAEDPKSGDLGRDVGARNSIKALKELALHAEKHKITICLEHLNTRDDSHPMKGHPGYQGDDLDWVVAILRAVGSPRVKLLFDIYHVQVMHGDVIRRLEQNKDLLGHIHTAGNPGRGELDENQEINYRAVMRKLIELKYDGYVGQEFIPTRDPLKGLQQAIDICDV